MILSTKHLIPNNVYRVDTVEEIVGNYEQHGFIFHLTSINKEKFRVWGEKVMSNKIKKNHTLYIANDVNMVCQSVILKTSADMETKRKITYFELR